LPDVLKGKDLAVELALNESRLRRDIFETAVTEIIPKIIEDTGVDCEFPPDETHATSDARWDNNWDIHETPTVEGKSATIRSKARVVLTINTDRPLSGLQALKRDMGDLATVITNYVILSLKEKYLGVTESTTSSADTIVDGGTLDFRAHSTTDLQGRN